MYNEAVVLNEELNQKIEENIDVNRKLKIMNEELEHKVYERTKELQKKNFMLDKLSKTDGLTGLYNHKYIYDYLEDVRSISEKENRIFSIIMFDIDHFKKVNDNFGHIAGDEVIAKIAKLLLNRLSKECIKGRYGGEEFLIILPSKDEKETFKIAEELRNSVKELRFENENLKVTISGGVAEWNGEDTMSLIDKADRLLYKAKESGRDKIVAGE